MRLLPFVSRKSYDALMEELRDAQDHVAELQKFIKELQPEFRAAVVDADQWKSQSYRLAKKLERAEQSVRHYKTLAEARHLTEEPDECG